MAFIPALIVGGQLVIAVADGVPAINFEQTCRDASSAKLGTSERVEDCADDEKHARDQLGAQWNQYDPVGRARCTRMSTASRPSSYVELLTCLEMDQLARKVRPDTATAMDRPELGRDREEDAPPVRRARATPRRVQSVSAPPPAPPPNPVLQTLCQSPLRAILPACR
jgi:hypothetical protein